LDGANAYWSIPVCEESMRLTAFHTPDGLYCWNRLLMGAKPSSAVQQSACLEALDDVWHQTPKIRCHVFYWRLPKDPEKRRKSTLT
jgi:hypothetical protein